MQAGVDAVFLARSLAISYGIHSQDGVGAHATSTPGIKLASLPAFDRTSEKRPSAQHVLVVSV